MREPLDKPRFLERGDPAQTSTLSFAELVTLYVASVRPDDLAILIDAFSDSERGAAEKFAASLAEYESSQRQALVIRSFSPPNDCTAALKRLVSQSPPGVRRILATLPSDGRNDVRQDNGIDSPVVPAAKALAVALLRQAVQTLDATRCETQSQQRDRQWLRRH